MKGIGWSCCLQRGAEKRLFDLLPRLSAQDSLARIHNYNHTHKTRNMDDIASALINFAENALIAGVIFVGGYFLARMLRFLVQRLLERVKIANTLGPSIPEFISSIAYYLVLGLAGAIGLLVLGVPPAILVLAIGAVALLLLLALQESVSNLAATIIFLIFQPLKRGEMIETMNQLGTVREILMFNTILELPDHRLVSLPNSKIQDSGIVNYTRLGRIRADVNLMVKYSEDLSRVVALIEDVAAQDARILAEPAFRVHIFDLGERGIKLCAQPTVAPADYWAVQNDLRAGIKSRFDQEKIQFAVY